MARYKARIDEIAAPHLRAMVKYVYLNLNIDSLMSERWQEILDMVLATLQTIIVTRAPGSVAKDILYDDTGALLVYPKLRELRLDVGGDRKRKSEADFERPDYVPFPVLAQVSVGPGDPHISKLLLRGNRESLVHIRLCLSGRTVTRLHNAGVLDGDEAWPALRHIELYRPALGMESDQYGDGRGSLSRVMFGQLVRWVLTTARDCPRIVLRGWRMELHLGAGELEPLVARLGSTVRHLDLPVVCTVADALGLVKRLPNLDYLGIALDGCMMSGDDIPADEYVRTAVAAQQSRLRTLAVQVDNEAGVLQQRQIALACALAKMTPSAQTLESRCAFREVGSSAPVLEALSHAAEAVRAGLAVKPYTAYPQWQ
ncbi:hypothetical protein H4R21_002552 [Coemansia helicoidea]|uniref:Uncharacterized protein n=1 Tax=Coemansia helicoidea TaxID=1286919 RepID=A0ACC1L5Z6_9FUNG|nr:hypothetical protein H4R21_002552 [Coemansia helicoidea]